MTNSPPQGRASTLSGPTELFAHFDDILVLGQRLVDELVLEPTDTLGRWMAQYVAELIDAVSTGPLSERSAAQERCFNAILELWSYRSELPDGKRPLAELEPVVRAIESLDPENERPRYYGEHDTKGKSAQLLGFVKNLDASARSLIRLFLGEAAAVAVDKSPEWLVAAEAAGMESGVHEIAMRFLVALQSEASPDLDERRRKSLMENLKRLEAFANVTRLVSDEIRVRLGISKLDSGDGDADEEVKNEDDAESSVLEYDGAADVGNEDKAEDDEAG